MVDEGTLFRNPKFHIHRVITAKDEVSSPSTVYT